MKNDYDDFLGWQEPFVQNEVNTQNNYEKKKKFNSISNPTIISNDEIDRRYNRTFFNRTNNDSKRNILNIALCIIFLGIFMIISNSISKKEAEQFNDNCIQVEGVVKSCLQESSYQTHYRHGIRIRTRQTYYKVEIDYEHEDENNTIEINSANRYPAYSTLTFYALPDFSEVSLELKQTDYNLSDSIAYIFFILGVVIIIYILKRE